MSVGIVAYGLGNVGSLTLSLRRLGEDVSVLEEPREVAHHSHVVIPGVGHYATAVQLLHQRGWDEALMSAREGGAAILGICLGMQLLAEGSTEAPGAMGLGIVSGTAKSLNEQGCASRTPHVGWNSVEMVRDSTLLGPLGKTHDFYFVHSYALALDHPAVVGTTEYGVPFGAVIESENVFGVQFHPEKSSLAGRLILDNFARYRPC